MASIAAESEEIVVVSSNLSMDSIAMPAIVRHSNRDAVPKVVGTCLSLRQMISMLRTNARFSVSSGRNSSR